MRDADYHLISTVPHPYDFVCGLRFFHGCWMRWAQPTTLSPHPHRMAVLQIQHPHVHKSGCARCGAEKRRRSSSGNIPSKEPLILLDRRRGGGRHIHQYVNESIQSYVAARRDVCHRGIRNHNMRRARRTHTALHKVWVYK